MIFPMSKIRLSPWFPELYIGSYPFSFHVDTTPYLYCFLLQVIPELLVDTKLGQSIKEVIALLVGVYMMVLIAEYE